MAKLTKMLLAVTPLLPIVYLILTRDEVQSSAPILLTAAVFGVFGFFLTAKMIPPIAEMTLAKGLGGFDLNKRDLDLKDWDPSKHKKVPESLGLVVGVVFLSVVILFQLAARSLFPELGAMVADFNAALHSVCFMILLGFADDVLDLRWRYKLVLPAVASLPLLMSYTGGTSVVVPVPFRGYVGGLETIDLGLLYQLYMLLLSIFCTNAINIYAGINGLEAGQSLVIACAIAVHNILELGSTQASHHLFSLILMLPFIFVTYGLLFHNWYPSRVFVGDTFTYFAGMTFAVSAILGHFSKTLMLFFVPQIFNFVYSLYQILFGPLFFNDPCPRHRLPRFNKETNTVRGVPGYHNLVNFTLLITGPLHEETLCWILMGLQAVCCGVGFFVRFYVAGYFYEVVE